MGGLGRDIRGSLKGRIRPRKEGRGVPHGLGQAGPDIASLFPEGSCIAPDGEEDPVSPVGPEPSGDFLSDLDHPEVLFGLIVRERDRRVEIERQDLSSIFLEAAQEILGGSGLGTSTGRRLFGTPRFLSSPVEDVLKTGEEGLSLNLAGRLCPELRLRLRL